MLPLQILIDGFAISSLYALGAIGFTLIFGVSGVLNLAHGGVMLIAALVAGRSPAKRHLGTYLGTLLGVLRDGRRASSPISWWCGPFRDRRAFRSEEKEIFVLTGTLLWGIMIQQGMAYLFTDNPKTRAADIGGVVEHRGRARAVQRDHDRGGVLGRDRAAVALRESHANAARRCSRHR